MSQSEQLLQSSVKHDNFSRLQKVGFSFGLATLHSYECGLYVQLQPSLYYSSLFINSFVFFLLLFFFNSSLFGIMVGLGKRCSIN